MVITGGVHAGARVSVYTEAGWLRDLAPLRGERWRHACTSYMDTEARVMTLYHPYHHPILMSLLQILIVTGGSKGLNEPLDSSEIYRDNVWRTAAGKLPVAMIYMRATVISNRVLFLAPTGAQ